MAGDKAEAPEQDIMPQFRKAAWSAGGLGNYILKDHRFMPYSGDWVADQNSGQLDAINSITQRGLGGSPLLDAANTFSTDTLNGTYLNQENPALSGAMDSAMQAVTRQLGQQFGGSGMSGSPAHLQYASEAFSNAAAPLYMQNYQQERALQQAAANNAPGLNQAGFYGGQQALAAQSLLQQQQQAEMDAERQKFELRQNEPLRRLQGVQGAIGGNMAQMGTFGGSLGSAGGLAGGLGGAASGAMLGASTGNPWVALGGGLLGGVGGGMANK